MLGCTCVMLASSCSYWIITIETQLEYDSSVGTARPDPKPVDDLPAYNDACEMRVAPTISWAAAASTSLATWREAKHVLPPPNGFATTAMRHYPATYDITTGSKPSSSLNDVVHVLHRANRRSSSLALPARSAICSNGHATPRSEDVDINPAFMPRGGGTAADTAGWQKLPEIRRRVAAFLNKRFFLVGAAAAVACAYLNPAVGATGGVLRPELTINKGGEHI